MRKSITPSRDMIAVTFRYYWRWRLILEEGRWLCYVPWMPRDKEVTLNVPIVYFKMLQNEKDDGASNQGMDADHPYYNARRYYCMIVIQELNRKAKEVDSGH